MTTSHSNVASHLSGIQPALTRLLHPIFFDSSIQPRMAARLAEERHHSTYSALSADYIFVLVAMKTSGVIC